MFFGLSVYMYLLHTQKKVSNKKTHAKQYKYNINIINNIFKFQISKKKKPKKKPTNKKNTQKNQKKKN